MSNIGVRKQNGDKPAITKPVEPSWDPWRQLRALLSWDPFREMSPFPMFEGRAAAFTPAFEFKETAHGYLFKADVPGIQERDLEVTITGNRLTIAGKREEEKEDRSDQFFAYERNYGSFSRSFTLPDGADTEKLRASLEKGVLTVSVAKKPEVQAKKVEVKPESMAPDPAPKS